jgi:hypothetical protein
MTVRSRCRSEISGKEQQLQRHLTNIVHGSYLNSTAHVLSAPQYGFTVPITCVSQAESLGKPKPSAVSVSAQGQHTKTDQEMPMYPRKPRTTQPLQLRFCTSLFLFSALSQFAPKNLADCVLGQFVHEPHTTSELLVRG